MGRSKLCPLLMKVTDWWALFPIARLSRVYQVLLGEVAHELVARFLAVVRQPDIGLFGATPLSNIRVAWHWCTDSCTTGDPFDPLSPLGWASHCCGFSLPDYPKSGVLRTCLAFYWYWG